MFPKLHSHPHITFDGFAWAKRFFSGPKLKMVVPVITHAIVRCFRKCDCIQKLRTVIMRRLWWTWQPFPWHEIPRSWRTPDTRSPELFHVRFGLKSYPSNHEKFVLKKERRPRRTLDKKNVFSLRPFRVLCLNSGTYVTGYFWNSSAYQSVYLLSLPRRPWRGSFDD